VSPHADRRLRPGQSIERGFHPGIALSGSASPAPASADELAGVRDVLDEMLTELGGLQAYLDHLRAEFVTEDAKLGTGTITDAEIEAFNDRLDQLRDEQLLFTFLGLLDASTLAPPAG